jgi:hypothetical protein
MQGFASQDGSNLGPAVFIVFKSRGGFVEEFMKVKAEVGVDFAVGKAQTPDIVGLMIDTCTGTNCRPHKLPIHWGEDVRFDNLKINHGVPISHCFIANSPDTKNSIMKALIIYDDFDLAIKTSATLRQRADQSDLAIEWQISPWRANVLKFPVVATEALMDAADAHLILFAGFCARPIHPRLMDWLERWVRLRLVKDAVLAMVAASESGGICLSDSTDIAGFANQHGLGFVSDPGDQAGNFSGFFATPLLSRGVLSKAGVYRGWEIAD